MGLQRMCALTCLGIRDCRYTCNEENSRFPAVFLAQKVVAIWAGWPIVLSLAMEEEPSEIGGMSVSQVCLVAVRNPMSGNSH